MQGELLRAVEKLRDGAMRNGNMNWDDGFKILLDYLTSHLLDAKVFPAAVLARTRETLLRLAAFENPLTDDEPFNELRERVVDYFHYYGSQTHPRNAALLR